MNDWDRASLTANAVNAPKELENRRAELRYRLRRGGDPRADVEVPKWTPKEMQAAGVRLVASVLANKTPALSPP